MRGDRRAIKKTFKEMDQWKIEQLDQDTEFNCMTNSLQKPPL